MEDTLGRVEQRVQAHFDQAKDDLKAIEKSLGGDHGWRSRAAARRSSTKNNEKYPVNKKYKPDDDFPEYLQPPVRKAKGLTSSVYQIESKESKKDEKDDKIENVSSNSDAEDFEKFQKEPPRQSREENLIKTNKIMDSKMNNRLFKNVLSVLSARSSESRNPAKTDQLKIAAVEHQEEKYQEESAKLRVQRNELVSKHSEQLKKYKFLSSQKALVDDTTLWIKNLECLKGFVRTETKPWIFYKPAVSVRRLERIRSETARKVSKAVSAKQKMLEDKLLKNEEEFEESLRRSSPKRFSERPDNSTRNYSD